MGVWGGGGVEGDVTGIACLEFHARPMDKKHAWVCMDGDRRCRQSVMWRVAACAPPTTSPRRAPCCCALQAEVLARHIVKFSEIVRDLDATPAKVAAA